jgi:hypothetical protein
LIVGFWQGTLRFGIFKFRLENIKEDDDMVLPDPNLSEQKRRISESLHGIKDIIELIRKAPEKYLPEEKVQSFNDSYNTIMYRLNNLMELFSPEIGENGNTQYNDGSTIINSLEKERLIGKVGIAKNRLLFQLKVIIMMYFHEQNLVTPKLLSAIMEYMEFGNTFVNSVENLIPKANNTPVSEFLSYTKQLISIRRDRMVSND